MLLLNKCKIRNTRRTSRHLNKTDEIILRELIQAHFDNTQSKVAKMILDNWNDSLNHFVKVMPIEYKRALNELSETRKKETA